MADRYFRKQNGVIFKVQPQHDIQSLESRFTECDANGKELKVEKKVEKPKVEKKKAKK